MKIPHRVMVAVVALSLALSACQDQRSGDPGRSQTRSGGLETPLGGSGATLGTLGGAAAGGLLGSQFGAGSGSALAALAGTLAGGYLGNRLGNRFDEDARATAAQAERQSLDTNQPADWSDAQAGASGRVRPLRSFTDAAGRECREYSHTVNIQGKQESGTGIACRQSDGSWSLVGS